MTAARTSLTGETIPVSEPVAVAVVGAGRMGSVHLRALAETRVAQAAAVVEPDAAARERAAAATGVAGYADLDALVEAGGVEGVVITAPSDRHLAWSSAAPRPGWRCSARSPAGRWRGQRAGGGRGGRRGAAAGRLLPPVRAGAGGGEGAHRRRRAGRAVDAVAAPVGRASARRSSRRPAAAS